MDHAARPSRVVVVGNAENRRVAFFLAALAPHEIPVAVVPWAELLAGRASLEEHLVPGALVRLESPGENSDVERLLLAAGASVTDTEYPRAARLDAASALALAPDRGRILHPRQWYLGFRAALDLIARALAAAPASVTVMNAPAAVSLLFDKPACQTHFAAAGVPVPRAFPGVTDYASLRAALRDAGVERAFVKLAHGSSASGVIAYCAVPGREHAFTSMESVRRGGELLLYNSLRVRRYAREDQLAELVDFVCREGAQVEEWVPKARADGGVFDLRVVAIAGRARHVVVRVGRSPMTNLHLGNKRGDAAALRARAGEAAWARAMDACERAAASVPGCLYAGVDVLLDPGFERALVLEANAFGDLLPGVLCDGMDTYAAELAAALSAPAPAEAPRPPPAPGPPG